MSDNYKLKHNEELLHLQYIDKVDDINNSINQNIRNTFSNIFNNIINNVTDLILTLGKPTFKNRQDTKEFNSNDYNNNIKEIHNDIKNSYKNLKTTKDILKDNINYSEIYNSQIKKGVKNAKKLLEEISIYTDKKNENIISITENFIGKENIDNDKTDANIMTERGMATLRIDNEADDIFKDSAKIEIMDDSNGFVGRLHKLMNVDKVGTTLAMGSLNTEDENSEEITKTKNEGPKFYAEEDPMIHPIRMIDGNLESKFEYEICNFPHDIGANIGKLDTDLFDPRDLDLKLSDLPVANKETANGLKPGTPLYGTKFKDGTVWSKEPVINNLKDLDIKMDGLGPIGGLFGNSSDLSGNIFESINNNKTLRLHIQIDIGEKELINWLDIIPYNIPYEGFSIPALTSLKIASEKGGELEEIDLSLGIVGNNRSDQNDLEADVGDKYEQIALATQRKQTIEIVEDLYKDDISDRITVNFSPREARIIDLVFEQNIPYDCPIGHVYWERIVVIETTKTSWFGAKKDKSKETRTARIAGERVDYENLTEEIDLTLGEMVLSGIGGAAMGAAAGISAGAAMGASFGPAGAVIGGLVGLFTGLWGGTEQEVISDEVETGIDIFDGWRYAISISNISSSAFQYVEKSRIISQEYKLPNNSRSIELTTKEKIPKEFINDQTKSTSYKNKSEWIKYFFSFDGGNTWNRIEPKSSHFSDTPNKYYINMDYKEMADNKNVRFLDIEGATDKIKFMTILSRPTDIENSYHFTPRLNKYTYNIEVDKDGDLDVY